MLYVRQRLNHSEMRIAHKIILLFRKTSVGTKSEQRSEKRDPHARNDLHQIL